MYKQLITTALLATIATSTDGYHFTKYAGNPILIPSETGFDTYGIGSSIVLKDDSMWVMYYNAGDLAMYIPGAYIGRATAQEPKGPWSRSERPVMMRGHKSEWDAGYILPNSILKLENGRYLMYYTAGTEFANRDFGIGMATSGQEDDPFSPDNPDAIGFEYPSLVRMDSVCFMYFDYDVTIGKIGVAVCPADSRSQEMK
jgi:predicted GH43/DUF377 family glycosyl hydrolase